MFLFWPCIGLVVHFLYGIRNNGTRRLSKAEEPGPVPCHITTESPPSHASRINVHQILMTDTDKQARRNHIMFGTHNSGIFLFAGIARNLIPGQDMLYIIGRSVA